MSNKPLCPWDQMTGLQGALVPKNNIGILHSRVQTTQHRRNMAATTFQRATSNQQVMRTALHRPTALQRSLSCPAACRTAQAQFTVRRDVQYASFPQPGSTVHFKGFASRVDFNNPHNVGIATKLVQRLKAIQPGRIVWDGDNYSKDSFTRLIPHMHRELGDAVELVAFLRECDQERFSQSWEATGVPVSLYLCPSALDWQKLGTHALEVTGSEVVVCYGGGGTVADEFAAKPSDAVTFSMFAISRPTSDGSSTEDAALVGESNASLEVVTVPEGTQVGSMNMF